MLFQRQEQLPDQINVCDLERRSCMREGIWDRTLVWRRREVGGFVNVYHPSEGQRTDTMINLKAER